MPVYVGCEKDYAQDEEIRKALEECTSNGMEEMKREKLFIWTKEKGYHYNFTCMGCKRDYELITGAGRYGNIGPFECPNCHKEYYATIDDHQDPSLYVAEAGKQPASLLDCEGRKRSLEIKYNGRGWY